MALPLSNNHREPPLAASESSRWFFQSSSGEDHGPMSFRDLREQALKRNLQATQLVWREGDETKYPAETIVGLLPSAQAPIAENPGPQSSLGNENPYATPNADRTIADGPPGGLYLPYLRKVNFPVLIIFLAMTAGLIYLAIHTDDPQTRTIVFSFAGITFALWLFFSLVYLHRAWSMMGILGAPISGTKAVSVLLVPLFNALWAFVAIFSWAKLWNYNVKRHPGLSTARPVWTPVFLLFCIGLLMSQVMILMLWLSHEFPGDVTDPRHQFILGTFMLTLILSLITWFQICNSINFLARKKI